MQCGGGVPPSPLPTLSTTPTIAFDVAGTANLGMTNAFHATMPCRRERDLTPTWLTPARHRRHRRHGRAFNGRALDRALALIQLVLLLLLVIYFYVCLIAWLLGCSGAPVRRHVPRGLPGSSARPPGAPSQARPRGRSGASHTVHLAQHQPTPHSPPPPPARPHTHTHTTPSPPRRPPEASFLVSVFAVFCFCIGGRAVCRAGVPAEQPAAQAQVRVPEAQQD